MRLASRRARLDGSTRSHGSIASDETARLTTTRAFAGALGGLFGTLALYPIDTVKTRIQAESAARGNNSEADDDGNGFWCPQWVTKLARVFREEGAAGAYGGALAKSAHSLSSSFLYFLAFSALKRTYEERTGKKIGGGAPLAAAAAAGCCNVLVTEPLDTYTTRKQLEGKKTVGDTGSKAFDDDEGDDGFKNTLRALRGGRGAADARGGLYSGLGASLALTINPAIQYTVFEQLRQKLMIVHNARAQRRGILKPVVELSMFDAFVLGAASKATATMLTYPLVRAKVLQKAGTREEDRRSLLGTLKRVHREEGVSGMYKGLDAQLVKTVLAGALTMTIKEKSFTSALWFMLLVRGLDDELA